MTSSPPVQADGFCHIGFTYSWIIYMRKR
uniref:Uncharacterized protein n=1 Tax=Anguilla anguilla TaxID=7936 RepID=A0A0E9U439_ANGAN